MGYKINTQKSVTFPIQLTVNNLQKEIKKTVSFTMIIKYIYEDFNIYGISDTNSTPANGVQSENDMSSADAILTIKTGESLIYVSVIITSAILGVIVIFISYNKIFLWKVFIC